MIMQDILEYFCLCTMPILFMYNMCELIITTDYMINFQNKYIHVIYK